jgi:hypothetical protein
MQKRARRRPADEPVAADRAKTVIETSAADTMLAKIQRVLSEA